MKIKYKKVFGYIRISHPKQEKGVSKEVQQKAIEEYALRHELKIIRWFVETKTASKRNRKEFNEMIRLLEKGKSEGAVIHKIDRSARNLSDWVKIGELNDSGKAIHFVHESVDLNERSGRLSADIQAVIAADYIRNLRQEAKKGIYGRLKNGIYPFGAPVGYLDKGRGNVKEIDPEMGALVIELFDLYANTDYGYEDLVEIMFDKGLRNRKGNKVTIRGIGTILQNKFYLGEMHIKGEMYEGKHTPLISRAIFDKVVEKRKKRTPSKSKKYIHDFTYRKTIKCSHCNNSLIGNRKKGHIYYRCQKKNCPTVSIREDRLNDQISNAIEEMKLPDEIIKIMNKKLEDDKLNLIKKINKIKKKASLELGSINSKIDRVTDLYLDEQIDKEHFQRKRKALLLEQERWQKRKDGLEDSPLTILNQVTSFLSMYNSVRKSYRNGTRRSKRRLLKEVMRHLELCGKTLEFSMLSPYSELSKMKCLTSGEPIRPQGATKRQEVYQEKRKAWKIARSDFKTIQEILDLFIEHYQSLSRVV